MRHTHNSHARATLLLLLPAYVSADCSLVAIICDVLSAVADLLHVATCCRLFTENYSNKQAPLHDSAQPRPGLREHSRQLQHLRRRACSNCFKQTNRCTKQHKSSRAEANIFGRTQRPPLVMSTAHTGSCEAYELHVCTYVCIRCCMCVVCMCIFVCLHIRMYACMYICMYACVLYVGIYVCMYSRMYACMNVYRYVRMYVGVFCYFDATQLSTSTSCRQLQCCQFQLQQAWWQ